MIKKNIPDKKKNLRLHASQASVVLVLSLLHLNVLLVPIVVVHDVVACLKRQLHGGQWTFVVYLVVSVDFFKKEQNLLEHLTCCLGSIGCYSVLLCHCR